MAHLIKYLGLLAVSALCVSAAYLAITTASVEPLHDRLDLWTGILGTVAVIAGGGWGLYRWADEKKEAALKSRLERLQFLHEHLLSSDFSKKRGEVVNFWKRGVRFPKKLRCLELPPKPVDGDHFLALLKRLQIDVKVPTDGFISRNRRSIQDTQEVCNQFEYIGQLIQAGALSRKELELFFKTMPADTFLLTLPYILYRRISKPLYAVHFQRLVSQVPALSATPTIL